MTEDFGRPKVLEYHLRPKALEKIQTNVDFSNFR